MAISLSFGVNGTYELTERLAEGETADVWAGRRLEDGREVVLKAYRPPAAALAVAEARRLRAVRHPAIVEVLDVGAVRTLERPPVGAPSPGAPFVVTARAPGEDLDRFLDPSAGRGTPERAAAAGEILAQALEALAHLHRRGVVHRDLHPGNVRVADERGSLRVTLLDFDLAVPVGAVAPAAGRLAFVPPEQLLGRPEPRSDLWALAAAVRWSLVRRDPLRGATALPADVAAWAPLLLRSDPRPLLADLPAAPPSLARTLDACLARDPRRRPASAREALSLLDPARARRLEPPDPFVFDPPFVGRAAERERLERAVAGGEPLVVVDGPEASGRRRLIDEVLTAAAERAVLDGRAVRPPARLAVTDPVRGLVELRDALAASSLVVVDATAVVEADVFATRAVEVVRAARSVGDRSAAGPAPCVVVACAPPASDPPAPRISLGPLDPADVGALAAAVLAETPAAPIVRALLEASGGWPGLVLAEIAARFPDGRPAVGARPAATERASVSLDGLDDDSRRALARLATEPLPVPEDRLGDDGASPPDDGVARVLPRLQRLGWLRRSAEGWSVADDRRATAGRLTGRDRRRLRQTVLAAAPARDRGDVLRRAFHRLAIARPGELARTAKAEASSAAVHGREAHASVLAWALDRSAGALTAGDLAVLIDECIDLGRYDEAARALDEAERRGLAGGAAPRGRRSRTVEGAGFALRRATLLRRTGRAREAERLLSSILRTAGTEPERVRATLDLADLALVRGDVPVAERAMKRLSRVPDELFLRAAELRARLALGRGDAAGARSVLDEAFARAGQPGESGEGPSASHRLWTLLGAVRERLGDRRGAVEAQTTALAAAQRAGDRHGAATSAANLGSAALEAGRVVEAVQRLRGAALDMTALGAARELPAVLINLAHARIRAGDAEGGEAVLEHAAAVAPPDVWAGAAAGYAASLRADAARQRGDPARAAAFLADALERPGTAADQYMLSEMRCDLADLRAQLGDPAAARVLLALVPSPAGRPSLEAKRAATELRVALATGETPDPEALVRAARALAAMPEPRDRPVEWRGWTVVACAARRAGRDEAARAAAERADEAARAWREEVREMGFDPLGNDPDRRSLEQVIAESGPGAPRSATAADAGAAISERELRRWLSIQRRLASERHPARLLDTILDTLIELVGAERGMLLTRRRKTGELVVRRARNLASGALGGADGGTISLSIAEEVARTGEPLLTMDARQDGRFLASRSVHDLGLRSVMVLPLLARGRTVGVAYLDHRLRESAFSPASVEAALDFAGLAALALETARHLRLLRRRRQEIERLNAELRERVEAQAVELRGLKETLDSTLPPEVADPFPGFVGRSPPMRDLFRRMKRVAETDLPVLILGESGTGKELVARALYARGRRRDAPFVTENCAAIPESLLESILFGHVRGAFTGADRDHAGLFVVADKGTLFLDEIGEMSLGLQSKLLRVLEDGEVRPVGGSTVRRVDVRIVAASNRDLETMVREGGFREDLYYRLAVLTLRPPPLRERPEDVPLLVAYFLAKHAPDGKVRVEPAALRRLAAHPWPGNVRQLENTVVRALVLAGGDVLDESCIDVGMTTRPVAGAAPACPEDLDLRRALEALERTMIEHALERARGNRTQAARLLGLSRFGLLKKMQRGAATEAPREGGPTRRG